MPRKLGFTTIAVLQAVAHGVRYGFDVIQQTELPSGTVYPALSSLESRGLVRSRWEDEDEAHAQGRPRRRYYQVTRAGREELEQARERLGNLGMSLAPSAVADPDATPRPAEG